MPRVAHLPNRHVLHLVEKQKQVLCDWLHSKAPGTLLKRVNALLLFHRSMGWQIDIPYKEEVMYNYMSDSRAGGAKPSQLQSLREALIFVRHVFSMEQLEPIVKVGDAQVLRKGSAS